jgi:uncharacterized OB-fold protein
VTELLVTVCTCGHSVFPPRALCPRCGSRDWHDEPAGPGTTEQVTTNRDGGSIASIALDRGPVVIARADGIAAGARVRVDDDYGRMIAFPIS